MDNRLVVGLAGMAGSGKSLAVAVAKANGYGVVVMGDVIREEAEIRHLAPTPENLGIIMLDLRRKEGNAVVAKKCIQKIKNMKEHKVIVDGIRSLHEVEEYKRHFAKFSLIAIHSSPETRFQRLFHRNRSDDPKDWQIFIERDMRELNVGLGNAIAMAEHMIVNEETLEIAKEQIKNVLRKVEKKWMT